MLYYSSDSSPKFKKKSSIYLRDSYFWSDLVICSKNRSLYKQQNLNWLIDLVFEIWFDNKFSLQGEILKIVTQD